MNDNDSLPLTARCPQCHKENVRQGAGLVACVACGRIYKINGDGTITFMEMDTSTVLTVKA